MNLKIFIGGFVLAIMLGLATYFWIFVWYELFVIFRDERHRRQKERDEAIRKLAEDVMES